MLVGDRVFRRSRGNSWGGRHLYSHTTSGSMRKEQSRSRTSLSDSGVTGEISKDFARSPRQDRFSVEVVLAAIQSKPS